MKWMNSTLAEMSIGYLSQHFYSNTTGVSGSTADLASITVPPQYRNKAIKSTDTALCVLYCHCIGTSNNQYRIEIFPKIALLHQNLYFYYNTSCVLLSQRQLCFQTDTEFNIYILNIAFIMHAHPHALFVCVCVCSMSYHSTRTSYQCYCYNGGMLIYQQQSIILSNLR